MDSLKNLFKEENIGQVILMVLFVIYLVMGYKTPELIANSVDNIVGKSIVVIIAISLFLYANPILAVLFLFIGYDLITKSSLAVENSGVLKEYNPVEEKKYSELTEMNQFPYTLEQEMVTKMAPVHTSGITMEKPTYKPLLDNTYDATYLSKL